MDDRVDWNMWEGHAKSATSLWNLENKQRRVQNICRQGIPRWYTFILFFVKRSEKTGQKRLYKMGKI